MGKEGVHVKSIKYNFLMNVILKTSLLLFPLITFPYVSRVLGANGTGKISFVQSVISYFTMFAMLGIPTYGIRVCAQCRDDYNKLSKTVHELLIISVFSTVLVYMFFVLCIFLVPKFNENIILMLIMSSSMILSSVGVEWFYQAIEQYKYITIRNILFKIMAVVLMFLFVHDESDYIIYGGIIVLGTVGSNFLNIIRLRKYVQLSPMGNYDLKRHIKPTLTFFLLTVSSTIYSNLDNVMVGFVVGDTEVGYYNAAVKIRSMLLAIINALATVLLPRVSYYVEKNMISDFKRIVTLSLQIVQFLSIPLSVFFIFEAADTIYILSGVGYDGAIIPMMIITPTLIFAGLNNLTGIQILGALGLEKYTVISTVCGASFDLILNCFLISKFGASGAAFSTLLTEILVLLIQIYYLKRFIKLEICISNTLKIIVASGGATLFMKIVYLTIVISSSLLSFIIGGIIFFTGYIMFVALLREKVFLQYILPIIKKILSILKRS